MNADEHDRMGHMTSDKRKRHLEGAEASAWDQHLTLNQRAQLIEWKGTEDQFESVLFSVVVGIVEERTKDLEYRLREYRDLYAGASQNASDFEQQRDRWKQAALAAGAHQSEDGQIWVITKEGESRPRRWWWPW